jgi:hypothetical protein
MADDADIPHEKKAAAILKLLSTTMGLDGAAIVILLIIPILVMGVDDFTANLPLTILPIIIAIMVTSGYFVLSLNKINEIRLQNPQVTQYSHESRHKKNNKIFLKLATYGAFVLSVSCGVFLFGQFPSRSGGPPMIAHLDLWTDIAVLIIGLGFFIIYVKLDDK